jgi:PAS domain-containing protein
MADRKNGNLRTKTIARSEPDSRRARRNGCNAATQDPIVEQLENELRASREELQRTVERLEASAEELLAMSDRLHATHEELEVSKGQLQSMNEERRAVNAELRAALHDLEEVNDDVAHFHASNEFAALILDAQLRIKHFTLPTRRLLNLVDADIGRPIRDLAARTADDGLISEARSVLEQRHSIEREIWVDVLGRSVCYRRRVSPYRTADKRCEGVVVSFVDVTALKHTVEELRATQDELDADLEVTRRLQRLGSCFLDEDTPKLILDEIVDTAVAIAGSDFGNLQLFDPVSGELSIVAHRGFSDPWVEFWNEKGKGRGSCGLALGQLQRVIIEDVEESPIFVGRPELEVQLTEGVRAVQSTPLQSRTGELIGMLSTHYRSPGRPSAQALRYIDLLARQAADILERARTSARLRISEEKYRALFESVEQGCCVVEVRFDDAGKPVDGRVLEANPSFERQTGIRDAVGRSMRKIAAELGENWFEMCGQVATTGRPQRFEHADRALGRTYGVHARRIGGPELRQVAILLDDVAKRRNGE